MIFLGRVSTDTAGPPEICRIELDFRPFDAG